MGKGKLETIKIENMDRDSMRDMNTRQTISYLAARVESAEQALVLAGRADDRAKASAIMTDHFGRFPD